MTEAILIAGFTGLVSSIVTITAVKVDVSWLKENIKNHSHRIEKLEEKIS
ncbi:MAG: hypothetical protein ACRBDL_03380 [Alphaproteobacteria bacterium]